MTDERMTDEQVSDTDDIALSALLDGALPAAEQERLRERLAREPALAHRLEALREADATIRSAYSGIMNEPLPVRVLELLSATTKGERGDADVVDFAARARAKRTSTRLLSVPTAIAAGVALAVGFVSSFLVMQPRGTAQIIAGAGVVEPGTDLYEVLQSAESAEAHPLDAETTALPRMTFLTENGEYCRQVDVSGARGTSYIIACRRAGDWRLELASFAPTQLRDADGLYRPATNDTPAAIESGIDAMIDGEPLGRDSEQDAMSRGWAPAPTP